MASAASTSSGLSGPVLVALIAGGTVAVLALSVYLGSALTRTPRREYTWASRWRDAGLLLVTAALALYVWGCMRIFFLYGGERGEDCFSLRDLQRGVALDKTTGNFIPLRLVCHMSDGRNVSIIVPDYANPTMGILLVLAVACGITAVVPQHKRRRTTQLQEGHHDSQ